MSLRLQAASIGSLAEALRCFQKADYERAWAAAETAIAQRPFHPEACLLLAELALNTARPALAQSWAERASELAPRWKRVDDFLRTLSPTPVPRGEPSAWQCPAPRLSVCLIARNEERFIARCLGSVRDLAHQIILVDTGSTDQTVRIARDAGAEVYESEWTDDFSAARNLSLEPATGDWILILDADEELTDAGRDLLDRHLDEPLAMAYRLPLVEAGRLQEGCHYVPRLFRNAPGLFFRGRIHEQLFPSLEPLRREWGLDNRFGSATLLHHGYAACPERRQHKIDRNLRLLRLALAEQPEEPSLLLNYGLELVRSGDRQAGLDQYQRAFQLVAQLPPEQVAPEFREVLLTQFSTHLLSAGQFGRAAAVLESPLAQRAGLTASQHFSLALALARLRRFDAAVQHIQACLAQRSEPSLSPVNPEIHQAGPHHVLACCYSALGQPEAAEHAFRAALKSNPSSDSIRLDLTRFYARQNRPCEALQLLHQLVSERPQPLDVWLLGARIALGSATLRPVAHDWIQAALAQHPNARELVQLGAGVFCARISSTIG